MSELIKNRYDFSFLLEVENGNPNGDPAMDNRPRVDISTGLGIISDVSIKRKIRDFAINYSQEKEGYDIYVRNCVPLQRVEDRAFKFVGLDTKNKKIKDEIKEYRNGDPGLDIKMHNFMCQNFYDIRAFGGVMTSFTKYGVNCGQIQGPVQICFGKSIEPIETEKLTITRVTVTKEEELEDGKNNMIGEKYIVPYALYRVNGFVVPKIGQKTGFTEDDLKFLFKTISRMYDVHHTSSSGRMAVRKLIVFKHDSELGNCPSYDLFNRLTVNKKEDIPVARKYEDYEVKLNTENMPNGVSIISEW